MAAGPTATRAPSTQTLQIVAVDMNSARLVDVNEQSNVRSLSEESDSSSDTASSIGREDGFCVQGKEDWAYGRAAVEPLVMKTVDGPLRECDWIDCPFCPSSVGEAAFSGGDAKSKAPPKESASRARASGRSRLRAGLPSSGNKRTSAKTRHVETGCTPAREKGSRASPSTKDVSSCPRPCDWIDCPICEQAEFTSTAAKCEAAGQIWPGETASRKSSDRKNSKKESREFYRVAVMLGLVPEL
ncbi:uncharacterized protein B0H18DRAFT_25721 [Fomitopsis serialis]|uniref:uncharacterized protein n=1 Tax=Fomitopsis serialis TaxID=139415 RepID=UPI002008AA3B|nr:uncharacterized protein B0H18DRAFT_25721 [Neoantrodia serialis]KAH9932459.1 hypothetical protein B0H18DRAFT_25721 [Neoantrodia serialis]